MIKNHFAYRAPEALDEALTWLAEAPEETAVVAGGTWTVVEMTRGRRNPRQVLDLRRLRLDQISESHSAIVLGANVTYQGVLDSALIADRLPILATVAAGITGGPPIRNRGTFGGSACYANPASDAPAVLVGLGATMTLHSVRGPRELSADAFFTGSFNTALKPDELLTGITFPVAVGARFGYHKLKFGASSWPIVTALCRLESDMPTKLVLGGAEARPLDVPLTGGCLEEDTRSALANPWADTLADGEYRRLVAPVAAQRAYRDAMKVEQ